jgi:CRP-like cAMP-binding protein
MSFVMTPQHTIDGGTTTRGTPRWSRPSAKDTMRSLLLDGGEPYRLTAAVVDHLVSHSQITDWRAGRRLFGPTDATDFVHFVVAGSVRLEVGGERDRWTIASFVPPGRFVGPILPPTARDRFTAFTHSASLIALVSHATMSRALEALPLERALRFVAHQTDRLSGLLADRCVLQWTSISSRLLHALRELAAIFGRPVPGGIMIDLTLTRQELARYIVASRSNVSRTLGRLRRSGSIDFVDRHIVVRAAA